jgi:hypothetical protein
LGAFDLLLEHRLTLGGFPRHGLLALSAGLSLLPKLVQLILKQADKVVLVANPAFGLAQGGVVLIHRHHPLSFKLR